ncbi:hypothetical protein C1H71_00065 [Iodobacter fluviatilis]|uniref:Uncharacterized protein n=2 Tax=Iodobacter fluviatilis TaxID=537 RepID=A0A7G3G4R5_9NEIS|nr:hypothetical protein C1H71_00065 [Iodobacter fluviatilis]
MKLWKRALLCLCLISMLLQQVSANAVLAPIENYVVNRAVAGIVANRIAAAEGIAANDAVWLAKAANEPVFAATMAGISKQMTAVNVASTVAAGALAIAGAPVWLTIAAGLGITALGAYYFTNDSLQKVSINQSGPVVVIQTESTPVKPAYTPPASSGTNTSFGAMALASGLMVYRGSCSYGGDCLSFPPAPTDYWVDAPFVMTNGDFVVIAYTLSEVSRFMKADTKRISDGGDMTVILAEKSLNHLIVLFSYRVLEEVRIYLALIQFQQHHHQLKMHLVLKLWVCLLLQQRLNSFLIGR